MSVEDRGTLLVVEDDPGVARLQQKTLERAGYRVLVAATAAEALRTVRAAAVDLLLLDQNLAGGVSGLELYSQVKGAGFDLPAILVTGFTADSIVLSAFRAGLYDFVPKTPDYLDYLVPAVERVLHKRRTEFQLAESEARLASIIRSTPDAVLTVDEDGRIGLFNLAAEQTFGLSAADAVGQPVSRFLPAWGNRPGAALVRWETDGARAAGEVFPAEASVSRVEPGPRPFWTCVVRDISERKRSQQERERLIQEQAARKEAEAARERMTAVARENARLYHELQRADRLKDEFLAMLAHELRNPLAPIRNALHLIRLEDPPLPGEVQENWLIIDRQVEHLVRLVDDLLDVSRISQGKIQLRSEPVDLATAVERAVESSRPLIDSRRHTLEVSLPGQPLPVEGDPVRLVQVLANLLNNAAKYTPEGGRIWLRAETASNLAVVRVRDTGVGIAPDMLPRLFDLFTQSERTLDRAEGGLGIGLMLVRRLTELHGGTAGVASEGPGKGSEFTIRLPLSVRAVPPPRDEGVLPAGDGPPRRVLIVDDNEDSAQTLARLLAALGHEVQVVHDGVGVLPAAESWRPEVILLDIGLPGMDGYEVARQIRARPELGDTALVALTGYGSPEDRQRSQEAGFDAHLVKPVDLLALRRLLHTPPHGAAV